MDLAKAFSALLLVLAASAAAQPHAPYFGHSSFAAHPQDPHSVSDPDVHRVLRHVLMSSDEADGAVRAMPSAHHTLYAHRAGPQRLATQMQDWSGAQWLDMGKVLYAYNTDGSSAERIEQAWTGSVWEDVYRITYAYSGGDLVEELGQFWVGDAWETSSRLTYAYTGGNATEWREQIWIGFWVDYRRVLLTYDTEGRYVTALVQDRESNTWADEYRYEFSYTDAGFLSDVREEAWTGTSWDESSYERYTYDAEDRLTELLFQVWVGTWMDVYREQYTYDDLALAISRSQYVEDGAWVDAYRLVYTNDAEGSALEELGQYWEEDAWANSHRDLHTYAVITASESGAEAFEKISASVYPNPTRGEAHAVIVLGESGEVAWALYDVVGRRIATGSPGSLGSGRHALALPLDGLPAGVYLLRVHTGAAVAIQRLTVLG